MVKILTDRSLLLLTLLGFGARLWLSFLPGFRIDVDTWFAWAQRLNQLGFANFYSDQIWTNYTPGFLYIFGFLGLIKDLLKINDAQFYLLLKLPFICSELLLGILIYLAIGKKSTSWALAAASLIIFNPALIFNSSIWGQLDSLFTLFLLLSMLFLYQRKLILSSMMTGLALLFKPQAIALLVVYLLYLISNFSIQSLLKLLAPALITIFLASLPFFPQQPFSGFPLLFLKMASDYSYTSLFAYNFWGIWGFWINDSNLWNGLTLKTWGYLLYFFYWIVIAFLYFNKKISILILVTLAALSFFFLPTRVHERYLYPAIPFLILAAATLKSRLLLMLTICLSLIHFLNLYYVYVYYNEFYLKMPKLLYNSLLYNLLDVNGKVLSFVSTIIFILITMIIIKSSYEHKKT